MTVTKRLNTRDAHEGIRELVDFNAGNVTGRNVYYNIDTGYPYTKSAKWSVRGAGYMPRAFANDYLENLRAGNVLYVVWSWWTPIAWLHKDEGWIIPNVFYSVTTSQHQGNAQYGASLQRESVAA